MTVKDFDEALDVANDVKYGLSSSIFTNDMARVFQYLDRIETGITHITAAPSVARRTCVWGHEATGVGGREMGSTAIEFFTEWKTVYVDYTGAARTTNIY